MSAEALPVAVILSFAAFGLVALIWTFWLTVWRDRPTCRDRRKVTHNIDGGIQPEKDQP